MKLKSFDDQLIIKYLVKQDLIQYLKQMLFIREVEKFIAKKRKDNFIKGPVHLATGQEAIAVGISSSLKKTDYIFGGHRSHAHLLALGSSLHGLFAELLGKETGHSKGMGCSMHLIDQKHGFYGSVPIVAGTIPIAVGSALGAKYQKTDNIAVVYFGDGACEEGVLHESLNLSKVLNLPILFVSENNFFASHMHISLRQPNESTTRFALAHSILSKAIDGNNIAEVANTAKKFIKDIRNNKGPRFLEVFTYRHFGHVDWREDIDVGVFRSPEDLKIWKTRDPILKLKEILIKEKLWNDTLNLKTINNIKKNIKKHWDQAMKDPYPSKDSLTKYTYK